MTVVLNGTVADHLRMGIRARRQPIGVALCMLAPLGGMTGCAYAYPEPDPVPVHPPSADPAPAGASVQQYNNTDVLKQEAENYAELERLLMASPSPVLLSDAGPLDGPVRGFGKLEMVPAAGKYTVTAACVGASGAMVFVGQEHPGAPFQPVEVALDCAGATSKVIALQQGYVFAHLFLPGPGDTPWTGAVGGVRVSGGS
jgi:hypothetical protein